MVTIYRFYLNANVADWYIQNVIQENLADEFNQWDPGNPVILQIGQIERGANQTTIDVHFANLGEGSFDSLLPQIRTYLLDNMIKTEFVSQT